MHPPAQPSKEALPRGVIPRVENQRSHFTFLDDVRPARVLVKLNHAKAMTEFGTTTLSGFPRPTTVITTTTIADNSLNLLSWNEEVEILKAFEPDFHIPGDVAVYNSYDDAQESERVVDHLRGYTKISELVREEEDSFTRSPPVMIPLIKSTRHDLLDHTFDILESQGATMGALYATQYFTGGGSYQQLIEDLKKVFEVAPPEFELLVIGCLGERTLPLLPKGVTAVSGLNRWRDVIKPQKQSKDEMCTAFETLGEQIHSAIGVDRDILFQTPDVLENI